MGEIVVYNVKDKDIPIVHRIVRKFGTGEKAQLLTKGDNNAADDTELCRHFLWSRQGYAAETNSGLQMPQDRIIWCARTSSAVSLATYRL